VEESASQGGTDKSTSSISTPHGGAISGICDSEESPAAAVTVIGPGAGLGRNRAVYAELARDKRFELNVQGKGGAPYDRYPLPWENGCPAPNLESFAGSLPTQGDVERSDCLVFGSRGGQVVLPFLWREWGEKAPPAVVVNGGCAMNLPSRMAWPQGAVTFLLIGGKDYILWGSILC
jgi:hypothetical protein